MIRSGDNLIDGILVKVVRKRVRRIGVAIDANGEVRLTVPKWWATLRESEEFLMSKWNWVKSSRLRMLERPSILTTPITDAELNALNSLLTELNAKWSRLLCESGVGWEIRQVKTIWGSCRWRSRRITYNVALARVPRELVEYVVVHEFTHFSVHNHGSTFRALMDERLPEWRVLRKRLSGFRI